MISISRGLSSDNTFRAFSPLFSSSTEFRAEVEKIARPTQLAQQTRPIIEADTDLQRRTSATLGVDPVTALAPALADVEPLFHLAAEKHNQSLATPEQMLASNVTGTYALFDAAARAAWIYVDDVVEATIRARELPLDGEVLNIGSGDATTINALTRAMLEVTGSKVTPAAGAADWTAGTSRVADGAKARRLLDGWRPAVSLRDRLARTFDWVKAR